MAASKYRSEATYIDCRKQKFTLFSPWSGDIVKKCSVFELCITDPNQASVISDYLAE